MGTRLDCRLGWGWPMLWWAYLVGKQGQLESWTSSWRDGAWLPYSRTLCRSTCRDVTYGHPMRSAKAGMLCRWICWVWHGDVLVMIWWGCCALLYKKAMDLVELWQDYGAFLLHGELRHLAKTFGPRHVCLLGCWLEMSHGAHDSWCCDSWGLHIMVDLDDLMHWGAEVKDFDAGWGAYFWVHLWVCLREWLDVEDRYETLWTEGVAAMMMPWWQHLGMGLTKT